MDNRPVTDQTQRISLPVARRFLVLRHLLAPPRALPPEPESVLAVVDRLGSLQFDPIEVAGRNHDLVLHARIAGYRRDLTDELLYGRRLLFEAYNKSLNLLPTRELPWHRVSWERAARGRSGQVLAEQAPLAKQILDRIRTDGPVSSGNFDKSAPIEWWWGPTTAVRAVLEALQVTGRISLSRREGNRRYYDLTERLYPEDLLATRVSEREQHRHRLLSRYRAHGLLGASGNGELWIGLGYASDRAAWRTELVERGELMPIDVEGLRGERFIVGDELPILVQAQREIDAEAAGAPVRPGEAEPAVTFLAPLDPLMWDRELLGPLFGFEYVWEVYTPAPKRRWGYYVLPLLFGDRIVGRIEPRIDRPARSVRVLGLHWETGFDPITTYGFVGALGDAMRAYLAFAGADTLTLELDGKKSPRAQDALGWLAGPKRRPATGALRAARRAL